MKDKIKIGLALSGASGRAIAHIGVLEVLQEQGIEIDYLSACSSGTIVAASYACGTLPELKKQFLGMNLSDLFKLFSLDRDGTGLFSLSRAEEKIRTFTMGKSFQDVRPMLNFVACDIRSGEPVCLTLGDLARASRISCSVPFLFSPEKWGTRVLVDGGLFSLIPVNEAREMGADIVIGVDISSTRYIFKKRYLKAWYGYNLIKRSRLFRLLTWPVRLIEKFYNSSVKVVFYNQSDFFDKEAVDESPDLFTVLGRTMDISLERERKNEIPVCDYMISPDVKNLGKINLEKAQQIYEEGRRAALEAIPEIRKLIENYKWRRTAGIRLKEKSSEA